MGTSDWKNLKIAILTPTLLFYSGIDRLVIEETKKFLGNNNMVTIFTLKAGLKIQGAEIVEIGMPSSPTLERVYRLMFFLDRVKIRKYSEMLKDYDVVISHFYPMNLIAVRARKKYPIKYIYHNAGVAYPHLFDSFVERAYMRIFNMLSNATIKNADEIISISDFLRQELKKETGKDSSVEYPEIDKGRFNKSISGERIRKKHSLGDSFTLLYVGRISPHKGIHILIEAFRKAKEILPELKLMIVGKPTFDGYYNKLKELSAGLENEIIFTGFVPDDELPEYYAAANVYATCSMWEGFDLPAVEAQACGKPVIAFNLCSHQEVIKSGILVEANNTTKFSSSIVRLYEKIKSRKK